MTTSRQRAALAKAAGKRPARPAAAEPDDGREEAAQEEPLLPGREAREKRAEKQARLEEQERRRKEDPLLRAQVRTAPVLQGYSDEHSSGFHVSLDPVEAV